MSKFKIILERDKEDYKDEKGREIIKEIDFYKKNKVKIKFMDFLNNQFPNVLIQFFLALGVVISSNVLLCAIIYLLFRSIEAVNLSILPVFVLSLISLIYLSIKAKDKEKIEKLESYFEPRNNFFNNGFMEMPASQDLLGAFKKEMGKQALIEVYVANKGKEPSNEQIIAYYEKLESEDLYKNKEFRLLYEDCIQKAELY
ncbi:hypothetical protein [Serratia sp. Se-RSBMAAmG]|uniref:hypothetical protein n=1 Tax=Serratia sp. Se-RSBMAAmG TaxID=3043305 RepID=UPI0024AFA272|nr:hypothetical protein [Serratia sp. Se-RSBMAAmG]MDI6975970.1 hypothetical protein [Serratia sp. Se-RSBMAAmG]